MEGEWCRRLQEIWAVTYGIVAIQLHEHSVDMFMYKSIKKSECVKHFSDGN